MFIGCNAHKQQDRMVVSVADLSLQPHRCQAFHKLLKLRNGDLLIYETSAINATCWRPSNAPVFAKR